MVGKYDRGGIEDKLVDASLVGGAGMGAGASAYTLADYLDRGITEKTELTGMKPRTKKMPDGRLLVHYPYNPKHGTGEHIATKRIIKGLREKGITNPIDIMNTFSSIPHAPAEEIDKLPAIPSFDQKDVNIITQEDLLKNKDKYFGELNMGSDLSFVGENATRGQRYSGFFDELPEATNVARAGDFSINYKPDDPPEKILPFIEAKDNVPDKKFLRGMVATNNPKANLRGKKIITVAAGGTGTGLDATVPMVADAIAGRDDVHVVILKGSGSKIRGDINRTAEMLLGPEKVTVVGTLPSQDFMKASYSSDLHVGYAGSSSLTEQLMFKNPSVVALGSHKGNVKNMARDNAIWANKNFDVPVISQDTGSDELRKTIGGLLDNPRHAEAVSHKRADRAVKLINKSGNRLVNTIKKATTHIPEFKKTGFGMMNPLDTKFLNSRAAMLLGGAGIGTAGLSALYRLMMRKGEQETPRTISEKIDKTVDKAVGATTIGGLGLAGGAGGAALLHKNIGNVVQRDEVGKAMEVMDEAIKGQPKALRDYASALADDDPVKKYLLTGDKAGINMSDNKTLDRVQDAFASIFRKSTADASSLLEKSTKHIDTAKNVVRGFGKGIHSVPRRYLAAIAGLGGLGALGGYGAGKLSENIQKTSAEESNKDTGLSPINKALIGTGAGVAGVSGSVLLFSILSKMKSLKGLKNLISKMEVNKGIELARPKKMIDVYDEYAPLAQDLVNTNFGGIKGDKLMYHLPPSYITDGNMFEKLKNVIFKNRMSTDEAFEFSRARAHYPNVSVDPHKTMVSEILTNHMPAGSYEDLRDSIKGVITQKDFDKIMSRKGTVADRLKGYEDKVAPALRERFSIFYDTKGKNIPIKGYQMLGDLAVKGLAPTAGAVGVGGLGTAGYMGYQGLNKESEEVSVTDLVKSMADKRIKGLDVKGGVTLEDLAQDLTGEEPTRKTPSKETPRYRLLPLALAAGATSEAGALASILAAQKYKRAKGGKDAIALTGGAFTRPYTSVDIGAGHKTPAIAAAEALRAHPDAKDFDIDAVIATNRPGTTDLALTDELGKEIDKGKRYTSSIDTRFGINNLFPFQGKGTSTNPFGRATFHADPVGGLMNSFAMMFQGQRFPYQKMKAFTYGPDEGGMQGTYERLRNFPDAHPLMKDEVIETAQMMLNKPVKRKPFLAEMSKRLVKEGNAEDAAKIKEALVRGKKIITISGSSRGDAVAINAKQLTDSLKASGRDDVLVIAQMAKGMDSPSAAIVAKNPNIVAIPFIKNDPRYLLGMQNIADLHLASTGASASAEAMASPTPIAVMENYAGTRDREIAAIRKGEGKRLGKALKEGSISKAEYAKQLEGLEDHIDEMRKVQLDLWNEGTQKWFKDLSKDKQSGVFTIDGPDAILNVLDEITAKPPKERALYNAKLMERGQKYLDNARMYKRTFADEVVKLTRQARKFGDDAVQNRYALAAFLATAGIAAPVAALNYIKHKLNKSKENKMNKASEEAMSPLAAVLQQAPAMPDRPGDPAIASAAEGAVQEGPADTRKLTIADKGMDGDEIKMTVESSKDDDDRINFLLNAFTEKTDDTEALGEAAPEEGASLEPAEEAIPAPAQVIPTL